jgi:hypothetical protein
MSEVTPQKISKYLLKFCLNISEEKPIYLAISPTDWAVELYCTENVERMIKENGGTVQYGWQIWEWPNVWIMAEFHAVWVDKNGIYRDITPKPKRLNRILFLPDDKIKYEDTQINSIRVPLKKNKHIKRLIDVENMIFEEMNKGDLKFHTGYMTISGDLQLLIDEKNKLIEKMYELELGIVI